MASVLHLTDENFDVELGKNPLILVDFWAEWCAPCRIIAPIVEELANDYDGKLACGKLNVDENSAIAAKFQIMSIPSLILFKNGEPIDKVIGAVPKSHLEDKIKPHLD
ncbi:MAG: thioredoxin [Candidatus Hydrothermarchaeaceae archaeon]